MLISLNSNTSDKVESMSNKYVPRFVSAKVAPEATPSESAVTPSRWSRDEDIYRISPKKHTLVNTSLPAKMAPTLTPATLSSLTSKAAQVPLTPLKGKSKEVALSSEDEFPTLGGKKAVKVTQAPSKNFSELSKEWAKTQKEDEAKAKEEAEKEALRLQQQQKKEEEEFVRSGIQKLGIRTKHLRYVNQRADDDDDTETLILSEDDEDDVPAYEEEEEEEEEYDGNWNARKHRDELY